MTALFCFWRHINRRTRAFGCLGFPGGASGKEPPANAGDIRDAGGEDPLEECVAPHSSILASRIPWTEEPGRLQPMGSQRVGHN